MKLSSDKRGSYYLFVYYEINEGILRVEVVNIKKEMKFMSMLISDTELIQVYIKDTEMLLEELDINLEEDRLVLKSGGQEYSEDDLHGEALEDNLRFLFAEMARTKAKKR